MWSGQTILPIGELPKDAPAAFAAIQPNFRMYGLGWDLSDYRGKKLVGHGGALSGFVSRTALMPELKLGVVVLTNQEVAGAFNAIVNTVLDHYIGAPDTDWVAAYSARAKIGEGECRRDSEEGRRANAIPIHARRCRWRPTPAAIAMPGTATSASKSTTASSRFTSRTRQTWRATWNTGSTIPSWRAGRIARWTPTPT